MPGTDILKLGVNKDEFNAELREVYDQTVKTYDALQKLDSFKLGISSSGWQDLKNSASGAAEAQKELAQATILQTKAAKNEAKVREANAKAQLAETKLREANEKAARAEAVALEKKAAAAALEKQSSLNDQQRQAIIAARKQEEQASINLAKSLEVQAAAQEELNAAMASAAASGNQPTKLVESTVTPQDATAVTVYRDELEKLTGTLSQNEALMNIYKAELASVQVELKSLDVTSDGYDARVAELTNRQNVLKTEMASLNTTIKNQIVLENNAAGSLDALNARLNLLNQSYAKLSATEKASPIGTEMKKEIVSLNTAVTAEETALGKAQKSVGDYSNSITKVAGNAFSAIRKLAYILPGVGIAGIFAFAGDAIVALTSKLFSGQKAVDEYKKSHELLNKVLTDGKNEYEKAVQNVDELTISVDLAKKGFIDKKEVVNQYNETMGKTTGVVQTLDEVEKKLVDDGPAYVKMMLFKAAANLALEDAAKKALEAEKERQKDLEEFKNALADTRIVAPGGEGGFGGGSFNAQDYDAETARINAAREKRKQAAIKKAEDEKDALENIAKNFMEDAAKISKDNNFNLFGNSGKGKETIDKTSQYIFDANKAQLEDSINTNKAIMDDTNLSLVRRMQAWRDYYADKQKLDDLEKNFQISRAIDAANEEIKQGGNRLKIQANLNSQIEAINAEHQTKVNDIVRDGVKEYKIILAEIFSKETEQFDQTEKDFADAMSRALAALEARKEAYLKAGQKIKDDQKKKDDEIDNERANLKKKLEEDLFNLAKTLGDARFENEKNRIQSLIDANNEYKSAELDRIQNSTLSEQEKADKTIQLNAKVDAQNKVLQQQQKEADIKKAKFDKAAAIAKIIEETAVQVVKNLDKPYLIPFIIATGAAELAIAAAQPIPSYAEGTENHPGGPARYAEAGPEAITLPGGKTFIADEETISFLPKGTKVKPITDDVINEAMNRSMLIGTAQMIAISDYVTKSGIGGSGIDYKALAEMQADRIVDAIGNARRPVTQVNIYNELGFKKHIDKYVFGKKQ